MTRVVSRARTDVKADISTTGAADIGMERGVARPISTREQQRWRWLLRAIHTTMHESYVVPLLTGTWLWNVWLRYMGADVSMGALVLEDVYDFDFVKVRMSSASTRVGNATDPRVLELTYASKSRLFDSLERGSKGHYSRSRSCSRVSNACGKIRMMNPSMNRVTYLVSLRKWWLARCGSRVG